MSSALLENQQTISCICLVPSEIANLSSMHDNCCPMYVHNNSISKQFKMNNSKLNKSCFNSCPSLLF